MKNCAESMARYAKAYSADYYSKLSEIYNRCNSAERQILKKNIFDMLDRMKSLLDNEKSNKEISEEDNNPVEETD